jgi:hypothetical protein
MCFELRQSVDNDEVGVCVGLNQWEASKMVVSVIGVEVPEVVMEAGDVFQPKCRKGD